MVLAAVLAGCASGPTRVTGQVRPAIEDYTTVTILTEMPEGAEQIAFINIDASSVGGISLQQKVDYAAVELKQQAAKVGANVVVISSTSTKSGSVIGVPMSDGYSGTGTLIVQQHDKESIEGIAVYVGSE